MKKRVIAVLTAVLMTASLAGCGSGKLSNDYVTVNKYKGLEVTVQTIQSAMAGVKRIMDVGRP